MDSSEYCRNSQAEIDRDLEESRPCSQCGCDPDGCACCEECHLPQDQCECEGEPEKCAVPGGGIVDRSEAQLVAMQMDDVMAGRVSA